MNCRKCNTILNCTNTIKDKNYCKNCFYEYQKQRWNRNKTTLVKERNFKCHECLMTGHPAIFDFHHLDPSTKEFNISDSKHFSLDKLRKEAEKCVMLCSNCHRTKHLNQELWDFDFSNPEFLEPQTHQCRSCDKQISLYKKFCSRTCNEKSKEIIQWPENLPDLVILSSKRAVAKQLGVSDKAVAKRLNRHHSIT